MSSQRSRVCIVTPGHLATNPRVVKEASALARAGYRVTVVCGDYAEWARPFDAEISAAADWDVTVPVSFGPYASKGTYARQTLIRRTALALWQSGLRTTRLAEAAHSPIVPDLKTAAAGVPADLYIGHYVAALPAVSKAARRHRAKYMFDAEDFHLGVPASKPEFDVERGITRLIESEYLPDAVAMTAASPLIAEAYVAEYGVSLPTTILNVFPVDQAPDTPCQNTGADRRPTVHWFSQTIGPDRGLEAAIAAVAMSVSRPRLVLRGRVSDEYRRTILDLCASSRVNVDVELLDLIAPSELERAIAQYDVGLCAENGHTINHDIALANKIFSFLLSGVPVLLSDISSHRRLADELGTAGCLFERDNPESLARAMDTMLLDKSRLAAARFEAFRLGRDRFNWDREKTRLLDAVAQAI